MSQLSTSERRPVAGPEATAADSVAISRVVRRISRNSGWLIVARLVGQGLALLLTVLVARLLGRMGMGQYALIAAVLYVGNVLTTFGTDTLLVREIARMQSEARPVVTAVLLIQISLSVGFILIVNLGADALSSGRSEVNLALRLASLSLLPLAFSTIYSAYLRAHERMDLHALLSLSVLSLQVITAAVLLGQGAGLMGLSWAMIASQTAGALAGVTLCLRYLPDFGHHWSLNQTPLRRTLRAGWPLAQLMVLAIIYQRLGIFTLSMLTTDTTTGLFAAAARIVEALKILPYAYFGALFPLMARSLFRTPSATGDEGRENGGVGKLRAAYGRAFWGLLAVMTAAVGGATLLAGWAIPFLYGNAFTPSATVLRVLSWSLLPFVVSLRFSSELVAAGKEKLAARATLLTLAVAVVVFTLFTNAWGLLGTSWAVVVTETVHALAMATSSRRLQVRAGAR